MKTGLPRQSSLVMVTFNRAAQLENGLHTLSNQMFLPDEIIIVDDGSTDNTPEVIEKWKKSLPIVSYRTSHIEHRISCIPRNIGIKQAKGEIVLFSEPEMLHPAENIGKLLSLITDKNYVVSTRIYTMGEAAWIHLKQSELDSPELLEKHEYAMMTGPNFQNTKAPDSDWAISGQENCLTGAFFGLYRKHLLEVGGFDESFMGHGFDDFDLFERLGLYGLKRVLTNEMTIFHQWHKKEYPYNIYDHAEKNGQISQANIKSGIYKVNQDHEWGVLD